MAHIAQEYIFQFLTLACSLGSLAGFCLVLTSYLGIIFSLLGVSPCHVGNSSGLLLAGLGLLSIGLCYGLALFSHLSVGMCYLLALLGLLLVFAGQFQRLLQFVCIAHLIQDHYQ